MVLPSDGGNAQSSAPQGGFRYQRGFYLIQPREMKTSGLMMNDTINCIGFTIGAPQSDTTKARFKVYLQNTTDSVSRMDTAWTVIPGLTSNYYHATNLFPSNYEWQIRANCSPFSDLRPFSNLELDSCQAPTSLNVSGITSNGATLNWIAPVAGVVKYYVEYRLTAQNTWTRDSTTLVSYTLSGLMPNSQYQWRVKTKCSTDSSGFAVNEFNTGNPDVCSDPMSGSLLVVSTTDTVAKLKWTGVDADYYSVRWRRKGTTFWSNTLSFADSITINYGLVAGTSYEWQIRTNCGQDSVGTYVQGPDFSTTGSTACYFPEKFSLDSITSNAVKFTWDTSGSGATTYELRYRAKDYITWANAINPMQLVHDDSICIPDRIGPYSVPFKGMSIDTFVYSGEGIYVAWEYLDSVGTLSSLNSSLTTIANTTLQGSMGQDSITYALSFATIGDSSATGLDTILGGIKHRPETRLCSSSLHDSVEVVAVYALGKYSPVFTEYPVSALIRNYSPFPRIYTVNLTVKEVLTNTIRHTESVNVLLGADTIGHALFTGWTPTLLETDSILVSIDGLPGENVVNNNRNYYIQMVTTNVVSFADGSDKVAQAGTDTSAGLTLSRHWMEGCGKINAVQVFLDRSSIGHEVYAVALDDTLAVLAQSAPFIPDSNQVDQYHSFFLSDSRLLVNENYYVGLAQTASPNGYHPVGVQYESAYIRDSAYFRATITGDSIWHQPYPGRLMIRAALVPGVAAPTITGDPFLCLNTVDTLVASSVMARYADSVIAFSSQIGISQFSAREALGVPDVYPGTGPNPLSWISELDTGREYLVLRFSNPDSVNFVDIFENYNPGAVDSIYLRDELGLYTLVWSGTAAPVPQATRRNRIRFPLTPFKVTGIRIAMNMAAVPGYSAVDAVCIGRLTTPGVFSSIAWTGGSTDDTLLINAPGGYKLTTVDANGCMFMDSITVITPVQVYPNITASSTLFCPGDSVVLRSDQQGGNLWSTGSTADSIYVSLGGSYWLRYDDGTGCGFTADTITVSTHTPPVANITGDTVICPNGYTTLKANTGFASYLWSNGVSLDSINVYLPGLYVVTVTDNNSCKALDTVITTAGVSPVPSIVGALLFCPGDSTVLDAGSGFSSYLWSTGATSDTLVVLTPGNYSVTVTNADGCQGSNSASTSWHNPPTAVISGNDGFCPQDSVSLTASGGQSFLWSTGSNSPMIYINTAGNYVLTVTDGNGCKDTVSKNIIQYSPPVPFIAGTLSFCAGGSVTALDAGLNYSAYSWSTGETSSSILVDAVGMYSVTVTDDHGCMGADTVTVTQEGGVPAVPGLITGDTTGMCNSNAPSTYSITPVDNSTCYIWTMPPGATIVDGFMKDSNVFFETIKVVFDNSFTGGYIEVAAHNDCGSSPTFNGRRIWVSAAPGSVPGNISGPRNGVCKDLAVMYSIPPITGAISYNWTVPLGTTMLSGQGTPSIMVSFASSYRTDDFCIEYSTDCGTSPGKCITVSPTPKIESVITGLTTVCAGIPNTDYSILPVIGATHYQWTVPTGSTILSGQGTNQISVNFGNHSGIVTVKAINDCGNSLIQYLSVNVTPCSRFPSKDRNYTKQRKNDFDLDIFPNPSNGIFQLELNALDPGSDYTLTVRDALGKQVYSAELPGTRFVQERLDLRHLGKGMYFLNISNKISQRTAKMVIH